MEPVDTYYNSDEEIAWGTATIKEYKKDLLRKKVHVDKRRTIGIPTSLKSSEDKDMDELYAEDLSSIISNVSKLSVKSSYYTPNQTLKTQSTENFINKMSEILGEVPDSTSNSFTTAQDSFHNKSDQEISQTKKSTVTSHSNSFCTALDVSPTNSDKEKSTLIDLTDSQSEDENLAGILEDIIEKLNDDIEENTDVLNLSRNYSSRICVDNNIDSQVEYSRYTCTQSKYEDISEVFEEEERGNALKSMSQYVYSGDDESFSTNISKLKDISEVYEENISEENFIKNEVIGNYTKRTSNKQETNARADIVSHVPNKERLEDGLSSKYQTDVAEESFEDENEKEVSVYNISSDLEKDFEDVDPKVEVLYLSSDYSTNDILNDSDNQGVVNNILNNSCKKEIYSHSRNIKKELNCSQTECSILEISSDISLNNPDIDESTLNNLEENKEEMKENVTSNNPISSKSVEEHVSLPVSKSLLENKILQEDILFKQAAVGNKSIIEDHHLSMGNDLLNCNETEINDSLGIIQLSMKNLEHTLFLNETKFTTPNKVNCLFDRSHVIEEAIEEESCENSSNFSQSNRSFKSNIHEGITRVENNEPVESVNKANISLKNAVFENINNEDENATQDLCAGRDKENKEYNSEECSKYENLYKNLSPRQEGNVNTDMSNKKQLLCNYKDEYGCPSSYLNKNIQKAAEIEQTVSESFKTFSNYDSEDAIHNTEDKYPKSQIKSQIDLDDSGTSMNSRESASYQFDDTLEEINRALELGLDYSMSSQQSEDFRVITPVKPPLGNTYMSKSARKPEKPRIFQSKLPISKYSHIVSPISVYRNKPTMQKKAEFKKPITPMVIKSSPAPGFQKNIFSFSQIQSPVSHYIKNTPTTPLQQNVHTNRNTNKKLFNPVKTTKTIKENIPTLPSVVYKPASKTLLSKEKTIKLPNKIEKLVPVKSDIVKHEGRLVKHLKNDSLVERKLLTDDLTIDGSMNNSSLYTHDVSVLTSKKAFIK